MQWTLKNRRELQRFDITLVPPGRSSLLTGNMTGMVAVTGPGEEKGGSLGLGGSEEGV